MLARVEVVVRPDLADPAAQRLLRQLEFSDPALRQQVRWARLVDVYWLDLPINRESVMVTVQELFWDPVTQWLFTGNLIPSAAGKSGGITDLMEYSPIRPGNFWAIEKRFRPGITDSVASEILHAFELVGRRPLPDSRVATGQLLLLEGAELNERGLARIARDVFCNERLETWSIFDDAELRKNSRFDQERVKRDIPRPVFGAISGGPRPAGVGLAGPGRATFASALRPESRKGGAAFFGGTLELGDLTDGQWKAFAQEQGWDLNWIELEAIRSYFTGHARDDHFRSQGGLQAATEAELQLLARVWSERLRHATFHASINYADQSGKPDPAGHVMPHQVEGLFQTMIAGTTEQLPKSWLISVLGSGVAGPGCGASASTGTIAFDEDTALVLGLDSPHSSILIDPFAGTSAASLALQRRISAQGFGGRMAFIANGLCLPTVDPTGREKQAARSGPTPRRTLDGVRKGLAETTAKSGVPVVNGALSVASDLAENSTPGAPVLLLSGGALMPKRMGDRRCETLDLQSGDRLVGVGGKTGREGLSDLRLGAGAPAVQLPDAMIHKRIADFLLALRPLGLHRGSVAVGSGGLALAALEVARLTGGVKLDLAGVPLKSPGMQPAEILLSESDERMLLVVPADKLAQVDQVAKTFELDTWEFGLLDDSGRFEVRQGKQNWVSLELPFVLEGAPRGLLHAEWSGRPEVPPVVDLAFEREGMAQLLGLLGRPAIVSKESWIRQMDHEAGGASVIKPLHTAAPGTSGAQSGPNDGGVLKILNDSAASLAVGTGVQNRYQSIDPWLMGQLAADEAVRNVLCVGGEYGRPESVLALISSLVWSMDCSREQQEPRSLGALLRACQGLQDAALALGTPIVAHHDEVVYQRAGGGEGAGTEQARQRSLFVQAVSRVPDFRNARTSDFKSPGDLIYLLGSVDRLGLVGSELQFQLEGRLPRIEGEHSAPHPDWSLGRLLYGWVGGDFGDRQTRLRSLHDISEGGLLVALAEGLLARGYGAYITLPTDQEPWRFCFGEGFHAFVATCMDADSSPIEDELRANRIPFLKLGSVNTTGKLELRQGDRKLGAVDTARLRQAWNREGFWE